eukprot:scaffold63993_cov49-Attheya_sp.AAC.1
MAPKPENSGAEPLDPNASTPPVMVHVVAPATLPEGYTFEAQIGGNVERTFKVEVPPGGVKEGETFLAPLPDNFDGPRLQAPTGQWKDVAMAQVMMRLRLDWLGRPGPEVATKNTFKTRENLREKFSIPEEHCIGCEDLCCSVFCNCCAIAQMSRHTGEHETYPGVFFTDTGLPSDAPQTV